MPDYRSTSHLDTLGDFPDRPFNELIAVLQPCEVITIIDHAALLAKFSPYDKLWDLKPKVRCQKCKREGALMIRRGERPAEGARV